MMGFAWVLPPILVLVHSKENPFQKSHYLPKPLETFPGIATHATNLSEMSPFWQTRSSLCKLELANGDF